MKYKKYRLSFRRSKIDQEIINHKNTPNNLRDKLKLTNLLT